MKTCSASTTDRQSDWAQLRPKEVFHEIMRVLHSALPPPASGSQAERVERDEAALAAVASLLPATAMEGRLAAQAVAADAWALDCLRLAQERYREFDIARKCKAQASSMMREAKSALRELRRLQVAREKRDKNEAASGQAAWTEHAVAEMMREAMPEVSGEDVAENESDSRGGGLDAVAGLPETPGGGRVVGAGFPGEPSHPGPLPRRGRRGRRRD